MYLITFSHCFYAPLMTLQPFFFNKSSWEKYCHHIRRHRWCSFCTSALLHVSHSGELVRRHGSLRHDVINFMDQTKKNKIKKDIVPPIPFSSCKISSTRIVNERLAVAMVTTCTDTELRTQNASQLSLSHATNLVWIKHKFTEEGFNLFNPNDHCAALMAPRCTISCFSWKKKKGFWVILRVPLALLTRGKHHAADVWWRGVTRRLRVPRLSFGCVVFCHNSLKLQGSERRQTDSQHTERWE